MKTFPGIPHKFLLTGSLIFLYCCSWGQDVDQVDPDHDIANYYIQWVSQYPASREKDKSGRKEKKARRNNNWFTDQIF